MFGSRTIPNMFTVEKIKKYSMIFSLPAVAGIIIPNELYYLNLRDWNYDYLLILIAFTLSLLFFLLQLFFNAFLERKGTRYSGIFQYICFSFALFLICKDTFAPLQLGIFDGANLESSQPLVNTIKEIIILAAVAVFGVVTYKKNSDFPRFLSLILSILSAAFFIFSLVVSLSSSSAGGSKRSASETAGKPLKGNIYHLHLDAAQSDYFLYCLKKNGFENEFHGFTAYEKNTTSYLWTEPSVASYLTSTTFHGGRYDEWVNSGDTGMIKVLRDSGYRMSYYGNPNLVNQKSFDYFVSSINLMRQKKRLSQLHDFFVIVSARIMPNCITNKTVKYSGKAISNAVSFFESKNNEKIPGTIAEGIEPYSGFLVLKKLIDDEKTRGGNGEFIYATPTLPHAPWVMDRFGKYNPGKGLPLYDAYVEQTHCAINLVVELIKELKRLNRYDNSMIVIHGDHGEGWAGNLVLRNNEVHSSLENKITKPYKPEIQTWGIEHLIERAQPVLMIKLPVASGSFTISDRKSQLIDIYPTVVDALKLPVIEDMRKKIEGVSLIEKSELINQRKRYAYYYPLSITKFKSQVYQLEIVSAGNGINLVPADFESKQFSNLVDFNTPIKFNSSGVSYGYTVSGWSDQEDLHRWTEGGSAVLSLKLPSVPRNDVFFSVVAWPLVIPNKIKSQKISVFVDGTYCSLWDISQEGRYEVRIPKSLVQDKQLTITFRISNPASPKENGMSEDYRKLGIAVKEIIVTEKSLK